MSLYQGDQGHKGGRFAQAHSHSPSGSHSWFSGPSTHQYYNGGTIPATDAYGASDRTSPYTTQIGPPPSSSTNSQSTPSSIKRSTTPIQMTEPHRNPTENMANEAKSAAASNPPTNAFTSADLCNTIFGVIRALPLDRTKLGELTKNYFQLPTDEQDINYSTLMKSGDIQKHRGMFHVHSTIEVKVKPQEMFTTKVDVHHRVTGAITLALLPSRVIQNEDVFLFLDVPPKVIENEKVELKISGFASGKASTFSVYFWLCGTDMNDDKAFFPFQLKVECAAPTNRPLPLREFSSEELQDISVVDGPLSSAKLNGNRVFLRRSTVKDGKDFLVNEMLVTTSEHLKTAHLCPPILGLFTSPKKERYVVYCAFENGKTLLEEIQSQDVPLTNAQAHSWVYLIARRIARRLKRLAFCRFVHMDLNSSNIIITRRYGEIVPYIIGWEHMLKLKSDISSTTSAPIGDSSIRHYNAHIKDSTVDLSCDVFSFGALLIEMLLRSRHTRDEKQIASGHLRTKAVNEDTIIKQSHFALSELIANCVSGNFQDWQEVIRVLETEDPQARKNA